MKILMDKREERNTDYRVIWESLGYEVSAKQMGPDYIVPELGWAIERKANDFRARDTSRIKRQLMELRQVGELVILAIDVERPDLLMAEVGMEQMFGMMGRFEQMGFSVEVTFGKMAWWLHKRIQKHLEVK